MPNDKTDVSSIAHDTELVQAVSALRRTRRNQYGLKALIDAAQHRQEHAEDLASYDELIRTRLANAVFVGHINTDLDSVAGAIGAAALFGGTPAISEPASTLNGEIQFALRHCGIETPWMFDHLDNAASCDLVLIDHTEEKQMVPSIRESPERGSRVVGVIDHHALAKTFYTSKPTFMDLRPWGSVSTIIAVLFIRYGRYLPRPLATLLLQAILSDTLNLRSVTTTEADRGMVALLASYGQIGIQRGVGVQAHAGAAVPGAYQETEIDLLAKQQFQAKTDWIVALGAYEMVRGDQKDFSCGPWKFGISVLEVTDTSKVLATAFEILLELRLLKKEKGLVPIELAGEQVDSGAQLGDAAPGAAATFQLSRASELDFSFLFVVNVVEQTSILLIPGGRELALAVAAFMPKGAADAEREGVKLTGAYPGIRAPGSTIRPEQTAMHLPAGYVSRKAQFVPAFFQAIENDFSYAAKGPVSQQDSSAPFYSATDTKNVLAALRDSKRGEAGDPPPSGPLADLLVEDAERAEDSAFFELEIEHASARGDNYYDERGKVARTYGRAARRP